MSVNQLQLIQHNLQNVQNQKLQMQEHVTELDSALEELKDTKKAYKIVGKIMISTDSKKLSSELKERKDLIDVRLKNFSQQEDKLRKSLEEAQKEMVKDLK